MLTRGLKVQGSFWVGEDGDAPNWRAQSNCAGARPYHVLWRIALLVEAPRRIAQERVPTFGEAKPFCLQFQPPLLLPALQRKSTRAQPAVHRYVLLISFRIEG